VTKKWRIRDRDPKGHLAICHAVGSTMRIGDKALSGCGSVVREVGTRVLDF
jgi:hypothetical protein